MASSNTHSAYLLGIDIGTSTVKVVLVEKETFRVVQEQSMPLGNHVQVGVPLNAYERPVQKILSSIESCMSSLERGLLQHVRGIGVCGQMHGCVLWKGGQTFLCGGELQYLAQSCTNLITWQDGRCTAEFVTSLPKTRQRIPISAGYGCATLAWLQKFQPQTISMFNRAGTVMDLIVCALCGSLDSVTMSAQNAASWGYLDVHDAEWEKEILQEVDFPIHLLPAVVDAPHLAGSLAVDWHGIPWGTPIGVAMGDLQCSIFAAQPTGTDAVLNIGSASQLAIITKNTSDQASSSSNPASLMKVPYFCGNNLLVAAALGGGNVIATFVAMLRGWLQALGVEAEKLQESEIYKKLISSAEEKLDTSLEIDPILWGERHAPQARGSVSNIGTDNLALGDVSSAMFSGIVKNLRRMMPVEMFQEHKIQRILGSGYTLQRNPVLQRQTERAFGLPLVIREGIDAPLGAAIAAQSLL